MMAHNTTIKCARCGIVFDVYGAEEHICKPPEPKPDPIYRRLPLDWSAITWSDTPPTVPGWYAVMDRRYAYSEEIIRLDRIPLTEDDRRHVKFGPFIAPLAGGTT